MKTVYKRITLVAILAIALSSISTTGNSDHQQTTNLTMEDQKSKYGINGYKAPELTSDIQWIDGMGNEMSPIQLSDHEGKFKVLYGFQSWCPGCHSRGLPALKKMVDALCENENVKFFAIQTVFEGSHVNTKDKLRETQQKYDLKIPFGHDIGNSETGNRSSTMYNYKTGGTPWFIFIDQNDTVVFNNYHLDADKAIKFLEEQ
ncbi:MAG: thiol-disulfide isomerase/thioredoxin [Patiriisocius sp.]|jgi:thiol-disulfide isomerase/thioredoxin